MPDNRTRLASHLHRRLKSLPGIIPQDAPPDEGSTHANYVYPIRYHAGEAGLPRNIFVRAVNAEFPQPESVESTALTEGYLCLASRKQVPSKLKIPIKML